MHLDQIETPEWVAIQAALQCLRHSEVPKEWQAGRVSSSLDFTSYPKGHLHEVSVVCSYFDAPAVTAVVSGRRIGDKYAMQDMICTVIKPGAGDDDCEFEVEFVTRSQSFSIRPVKPSSVHDRSQ